jgi:cell division protein ZapA (FtsZ GTPase activity inhibitor)
MSTETGSHEPDDSEVFLVRLWSGEVANQEEAESMESIGIRVQGKVTHLLSGKGSIFSDSATLMSMLLGMLSTARDGQNTEEEKGA